MTVPLINVTVLSFTFIPNLITSPTCLADPLVCLTFSATIPKICTSLDCLSSSSLRLLPQMERKAPRICSYLIPCLVSCKVSFSNLKYYITLDWVSFTHAYLSHILYKCSRQGIKHVPLLFVSTTATL